MRFIMISMSVTPLTADTFAEKVSTPGIVIVDCWAAWCAPCRAFKPVFEAAAAANPDILFCSVDTEAEQDLGAELGITSIPTVLAFRDGKMVFNRAGAFRAPDFDRLITAIRNLDA